MSKNLEREYRALVGSEVPDLWDRIEAGLDDKKTDSKKNAPETDFPKADSQSERACAKKVNFKAWAGLAAACVCVALIVPAVARTMILWGGGSSYSNTASSDTPRNDTTQAAESCEKAETAKPEAAGEAAADNAAAAVENGMSDSAAAMDSENAAVTSNKDTVNVDSGALEEEPYSFRVTVEILDMGVSMNGGILYTARAITSENPDIDVDSEIKVLSPTVALEDSKTYDLVLSEAHLDDSGEEKTYLIVNDAVE